MILLFILFFLLSLMSVFYTVISCDFIFFLLFECYFLIHLVWFVIFFFFFQAEDGIRDIGVTGVQTCALPIFSYSRASRKNTSCSRSELAWSRLPEGSSASTRLGSCTRARATAQRCCSPPDNSIGRCDMRPASPTSESTSSARDVAGRDSIPPISNGIITFSKAENSRKR